MDGNMRPTRRQVLKLAAGGLLVGTLGTNQVVRGFSQEASPTPEVLQQLLVEATFPASTFPDPTYFTGFCISTEPPKTSTTYSMPDNVIQMNYVIDGALTMEKSGPALVLRADGSVEDFGADETFTLDVGDTRIITDHSRYQVYANTGLVLNRWTYFAVGLITERMTDYSGKHLTDEACVVFSDTEWMKGELFGKNIHLRLERMTLAPGMVYKIPNDPYPIVRILSAGRLEIGAVRVDGTTAKPLQQWPGPIQIRTFDTIDHWILRSTGEEPAVIYQHALEPVDGEATPTA